MTIRRIGKQPDSDPHPDPRPLRTRRANGDPPVRRTVRSAKIASLPVAFAGRHAAGMGRRAMGRSADEVNADIQRRTAQHIFEVLGELKGCAAKLGQLMSVYELVLPPEIAEPYRIALGRLQDSAPAMLPPAVHAVMAANLGADWRDRFCEFDDRRAAAASIGQVHRAVWFDGRPVAVKIMYPGARQSVRSDLDQLRRIAYLAHVVVPGADVAGVAEAICACIGDELDYAAEAEYQRTFAAAYANDPDFVVPQVVAQYDDVLVGEWLDGIPLSRIIASGAPAERSRVGMLLLRFILSCWRRSGLLYCDPHPGNFRVLPDGRIGVVDFGACTPWPPPGFAEVITDVGAAIVNEGPAELEAAIRRHGFIEEGRDFDVEAVGAALRRFCEPAQSPTFGLSTKWLRPQLRRAMTPGLSNIFRPMDMPASWTPLARAGLTAIGVLCQLGTEGPIRDELIRWSPELADLLNNSGAEIRSQPERASAAGVLDYYLS